MNDRIGLIILVYQNLNRSHHDLTVDIKDILVLVVATVGGAKTGTGETEEVAF
jgi:hypothetical protein